jgi:hypothetical protein
VILVVADGRSSASVGMTCDELIAVFQELGAHDAMGLDGGGSSTLWSSAGLINRPSDAAGERTVRNHLAIFATGAGAAPHCGLRAVVTEPPMATAVPTAALPRVAPLTAPSRFRPLTPVRLFDTRAPETSARLVRGDGSSAGPIALTSSGAFRDWAAVGVAPDASAVWLNVTAVGLLVPGYVTVFPNGRPRPETSNVNYAPLQVVANAAPVALGAGSQVNFEAHAAVDVIADLAGSFSPTGAGLATIAPTRVLDTRTPSMPLRAGVARAVDVRAPADAVGVVTSVAVIAGAAGGFLTASPCGAPVPATSNINYAPGSVVANAVVSALGRGQLCLTASTDLDAVVDVTGYLTPTAPLSYVPLFPQRLLDTRTTSTPFTGRVGAGQVIELPVQRLAGMPSAVGAVVANVTVTDAAAAGYITTFPCTRGAPETSTLNYPADRAVGGLTSTAVDNGSLCLLSSARAHVIVDLLGVWVTPPPSPDAGVPDATAPDATALDASVRDATAVVDAAPRDATVARDTAAMIDAVPDVTSDTGAAIDAGGDDAIRGTCGCRAQGRTSGRAGALLLALTALSALRRRRTAARAPSRSTGT